MGCNVGQYLMRGFAAMLGLLLFVARLHAQEAEVPLDLQVPLMLKATAYDRTFNTKLQRGGTLVVGLCYQSKHRTSLQEMEALQETLLSTPSVHKIKVVLIDVSDSEEYRNRSEWAGISAAYITSMRGFDLDPLLVLAEEHQFLTVSTSPGLAQRGVVMSFDLVGSRPKFVINRDAALGVGCDFSSQLLKLATIY